MCAHLPGGCYAAGARRRVTHRRGRLRGFRWLWPSASRASDHIRASSVRAPRPLRLTTARRARVSARGLRYVQLNSSHLMANTRKQTVNIGLSNKPRGCVVWIKFDQDTLELGPFLWFGGSPTENLPPFGDRPARHTRRNRTGTRSLRENLREVSEGKFAKLPTMSDLVTKLFGSVTSASQSAKEEPTT